MATNEHLSLSERIQIEKLLTSHINHSAISLSLLRLLEEFHSKLNSTEGMWYVLKKCVLFV